ncbi:MAG: alpha/beta hydrolase [Bacteroidota bacterium]
MKKLINKYLPRIIGLQINSIYAVNKKKAVIKVYRIFCTPRGGRIKPHHQEFLNPARVTKFTQGSLQLQTYHWKNDGPTVLLVHGWDSNTHRWKNLILKLQKKNFNVVAFDAPAQGYSDGKVLNVPLYAKCIQKIIQLYQPKYAIGHSMGGMSIFFNEYLHPKSSIKKIVSLGAPSEMEKIILDLQQIMRLNNKLMNDVEDYFENKFGYRFGDFSTAKFAQKVEKEVFVIQDKYDKIVPFRAGVAIHNSLKNSKFLETEGAGHSLNTDKIHHKIISFLE